MKASYKASDLEKDKLSVPSKRVETLPLEAAAGQILSVWPIRPANEFYNVKVVANQKNGRGTSFSREKLGNDSVKG